MKCCDRFAGKLIHKIIVERETETPDMRGGAVITWTQIANPWAFVEPVSAGEAFSQQRLNATITHKIHTRHRTDLRTSDRIKFNGETMQIRSIVNQDNRNIWTVIDAVQQVAT